MEPRPGPMPTDGGNGGGGGTVADGGPGEFIGPAAAEPMLVRPRPLARGGTPAGVAIESGTTRTDPPPPPQGLMRRTSTESGPLAPARRGFFIPRTRQAIVSTGKQLGSAALQMGGNALQLGGAAASAALGGGLMLASQVAAMTQQAISRATAQDDDFSWKKQDLQVRDQ